MLANHDRLKTICDFNDIFQIKKEVKKEEVKKEEDLSDDYSDTEEYDFSQHNVLSEYERQREENMKRNKEIMDQLNIKQVK